MNKCRKELILFQKCKEEILQTEMKLDEDIGMPTKGKVRGIFLWEAAVALYIKTQNPASLYLQGKVATSLHTFTAIGHLIPGKGTSLEKNMKKNDATLSARGPGYQSW